METRCAARIVSITVVLILALGCAADRDEPVAIPDSPDGTVEVVLTGLARHRPEVLWCALPTSYQQDVLELAAAVPDSVDPALFDRAVAVARKGTMMLQRKKQIILASQSVRRSELDSVTLDAMWESAMLVVDDLLTSDLARLEAYRDLDVESLLGTTGRAVMDHAGGFPVSGSWQVDLDARLDELARARVEVVGRADDAATVRIIPPGGEPVDVAMVRVEDRWLPSAFVERWAGVVANARGRIERLGDEQGQQTKMQVFIALGIAERVIDQLDRIETPEDVDALIANPLAGLFARSGGHHSD